MAVGWRDWNDRHARLRRGTRAGFCLLGVALAIVWFALLRPVALGGPASYVVVSGISMEPRLHSGDLVIVQVAPSYHIGDLVAYRVPQGQAEAGKLVIHRIIAGDTSAGFVMKGDNNKEPDPWHPHPSDILGRGLVEFPGSGRLLIVARQPLVLATLLGGLAGFWLFTSGPGAGREPHPASARPLAAWRRRRTKRASDEMSET